MFFGSKFARASGIPPVVGGCIYSNLRTEMKLISNPISMLTAVALVITGWGCGGNDDQNKEHDPIFVVAQPDKRAQLQKDIYPTGTCIALRLEAIDKKNKKPLALKNDLTVTFNKRWVISSDQLAKVDAFNDANCKNKISEVILPEVDQGQSAATIYIRSMTEGRADLFFQWKGNGWSVGKRLINVIFSKPTE